MRKFPSGPSRYPLALAIIEPIVLARLPPVSEAPAVISFALAPISIPALAKRRIQSPTPLPGRTLAPPLALDPIKSGTLAQLVDDSWPPLPLASLFPLG